MTDTPLSEYARWLRAKLDEAHKADALSINFTFRDAVVILERIENLERRCAMLAEHVNGSTK